MPSSAKMFRYYRMVKADFKLCTLHSRLDDSRLVSPAFWNATNYKL